MEVVFIKAKWDSPNKEYISPILKHLPSGNVEVTKNVEYKDGMYIAQEYSRDNGEYLSIGIRSNLELERVEAVGKLGYKRELVEIEKGIWISCAEYIWNETRKIYEILSAPIGINQCGIIEFKGTLKNNKIVKSDEIKIISSLLTEDEYKEMQDKICTITERLLCSASAECGDSASNGFMNLELLNSNINELKYLLNKVENSPQENLISVKSKIKIEKITKLDARSTIEQEMYPFKEQIYATSTVRSYDIKEHRMIKLCLIDFFEVCERQIKYEEKIIESMLKEIDELNKKVALEEKDNELKLEVEMRKSTLNKNICDFEERLKKWHNIIYELEDMLQIDIFKGIGYEKLEQTHVFNFNPIYQEVYDYLQNMQKLLARDKQLSLFQNDLIKSPYLYEKWVLFEVIDYFRYKLKFYPLKDNEIKIIVDYYNKHNSLRGLELRFKNKMGKYISITSEKRIGSNSNMYPDISIRFIDKNKDIEVFLDAKYKEYSVNHKSLDILKNDIVRSAKRYKDSCTNCRGAFIVHPDKNLADNYDFKFQEEAIDRLPHQYGNFILKPSDDKGIHTIAKLIIHFFLDWEKLCPDCGDEGLVVKNYTYKCHYKCGCNAFWVQSKCWNDKKHNKIKIYKYMPNNYHRESPSTWDVHCPICGKSYEDYLNNK